MPHLQRWQQALRQVLVSLTLPRTMGDNDRNRIRNHEFGVLNLISDIDDPRDAALTRVLIHDVERALSQVDDLLALRCPAAPTGLAARGKHA